MRKNIFLYSEMHANAPHPKTLRIGPPESREEDFVSAWPTGPWVEYTHKVMDETMADVYRAKYPDARVVYEGSAGYLKAKIGTPCHFYFEEPEFAVAMA